MISISAALLRLASTEVQAGSPSAAINAMEYVEQTVRKAGLAVQDIDHRDTTHIAMTISGQFVPVLNALTKAGFVPDRTQKKGSFYKRQGMGTIRVTAGVSFRETIVICLG
ncbi:hypothetical protein [Ralstonia phage phiRSL1]|uniref:Uncharacterized protein n=1 Tax=Ralstonia phage phiRSL1 TaxID=1980924 RepID=B2ZXY5_9CAUD|nr:hypothetical protein RSL1_ORF127 [Ralstonia phage phiRSL1]BAG41572.1 hypothetical protein [Ralstonia phage phiRSL1]